MHISEINCYPVKSLKGISLSQATLHATGLTWDRHWMLVDARQRFVTQRQLPALATISVRLDARQLTLEHPSMAPLAIPLALEEQKLRIVSVWNDHCKAYPESREVSRWLVGALGEQAQGLSLVRFAEEFKRPVEEDFLQGGHAHTQFADGYPFLVATTASLNALNQVLENKGLAPVPMNRFRPNIVLEGATPWAEDGWDTLTAAQGAARLGLRRACQRCRITTIDQANAAIPVPSEPLKSLIEIGNQPTLKGAYFGRNAVLLEGEGQAIKVGDTWG
ncbi:MOSC N-terminal beta barrel domain-containing protein [Vreelandella rituensis]|uniref:MOSC domain-containing protein n=1 Tax=Vreelandella rituensis TaxID=2282306 RepID=A0A368U7N2_9GAMM|nr:MOSC N-terminal beta barrel domain-containing protein [Halomonas rituensis]RCV92954.1 MOSC domain-containing protein [Halomonas rituensis]